MSMYSSVFYLRFALAGVISLASISTLAAEISVSAKFAPDAGNPQNNNFQNTTPNSGFCRDFPVQCGTSLFSISFPGSTSQSSIVASQSDMRKSAMIKVPSEWRRVDVVGPGGNSKVLEFRVVGFGADYLTSFDVRELTGLSDLFQAHAALWHGGQWVDAPSPCMNSPLSGANPTLYRFFWRIPSAVPCGKLAKIDIPGLRLSRFSLMYELKAPNPLEMSLGTYTGKLAYLMGPGQDFDFGDLLIPSESSLTLNFSLEVLHLLKVQFPPGSDRLTLNPQGGWQQWVLHGRRPEKLFGNQNFQLWASSPFKMQLQCQYAVGDQCGIQNEVGDLVPVETRITLPPGLLNETNAPVNRHLLSISTPSIFHPTYYVDDGRATLNFEVGKSSVVQMTNHSGSRYVGNVTVVWDADI